MPRRSPTDMSGLTVRAICANDLPWVARVLEEHWHSTQIVTRGRTHEADRLPGFAAELEGQPVGLVTYQITGDQCELVSLNSLRASIGIGSALLQTAQQAARAAGCRRLWLITTNDNLAALRFYQKQGWRLVAIHRDAVDESRRLKPEIPLSGIDGIPLHDEIELELLL
jgi:ribosomal protein S18 acetylase RimI-like enzyme